MYFHHYLMFYTLKLILTIGYNYPQTLHPYFMVINDIRHIIQALDLR
jgi:hypothetical protein